MSRCAGCGGWLGRARVNAVQRADPHNPEWPQEIVVAALTCSWACMVTVAQREANRERAEKEAPGERF